MQDFLPNNTQVVMFSAADFREIVNNAAEEIARNTIGQVLPLPSEAECEEEYLSRREVADKFGVDLSTLWRWNRDGFLPCISLVARSSMPLQRFTSSSTATRVCSTESNGNFKPHVPPFAAPPLLIGKGKEGNSKSQLWNEETEMLRARTTQAR